MADTNKEKLVPEIRFKGYTDAWGQRRLWDMAEISSGGTPSRDIDDYWNGDIPWATTAEVNYSLIVETSEHISEAGLNNSSAKVMPIGTILMAMYGQGKTRGQVAMLGIEAATNQANANIIVNQGISNAFIYHQLVKNYESIRSSANEGGQANLSLGIVKELPIAFTENIGEQTAIGNFFHTLDTSLTLHKRKLDKLRELKKGYLQIMFPQSGESLPRVRFAGLTGDWEVSRLDEVFAPSVPNNTLSRVALNYDGGEVRNIHYGDVLMKFGAIIDSTDKIIPFITNAKASDFKSHILQDGDIIFADTAEDEMVGKAVEVMNTKMATIVSGLHTYVYRPQIKTAPCFFGYYLNSQSYRRQLLTLMQGIKVLSINRSNLSKTLVSYPASLDEQTAIGIFFRTLDKQITAQSHKLEQLKRLKSAYLQKMFI